MVTVKTLARNRRPRFGARRFGEEALLVHGATQGHSLEVICLLAVHRLNHNGGGSQDYWLLAWRPACPKASLRNERKNQFT
jgi:hypothetical protein